MTVALVLYQADNTGRMTDLAVNLAHVFPIFSPAQRLAGITQVEKVFIKNNDADNSTILSAKVFLRNQIDNADIRAYFAAGTQRDTVATMSARKYATGVLHAAISSGATALIVDFKLGSAADAVVQAADTLFISDGTTEEFIIVDAVDWTGEQAAITLTTAITGNYSIGDAVGSCLLISAIQAVVDNLSKTFSTISFDETTYPIVLENLSTIEQTITLTLLDATTFSVLSDKVSNLPNGSTLSDYAPINASSSLPYFTIPAFAWSGLGTAGETMTFQTHPAAQGVFLGTQVYAGAAASVETMPLSVVASY